MSAVDYYIMYFMIKSAIIDENINSQELIKNYLAQNGEINSIDCFSDFSNVNSEYYDLIIFDINSNNKESAFNFIKEAQQKETKLIAISYEISSSIVAETLSAGADDFLIKPVLKNILDTSIKKIFLTKEEKNIALSNAIAFFSSKGGIGKTSAVVNLGYDIAKIANKKICILDLSFNSENAACYLGLKNLDYNFALSILKNGKETILSLLPRYENSNLYVLSFLPELNFLSFLNQDKITYLISSLKNVFDYVFIDTIAIMNESVIPVLNCSALIIYSAVLNSQSVKTTLKHFEMFSKTSYNKSCIKLLINRYTDSSEEQLKILENELGKKADYKIPNNYLTIMDAINRTSPLDITNPNSNIAKAYMELAQEITNLKVNQNMNNSCTIFNLLKRMGE